VISAPSGAGKTTLCRRLLKTFPNLSYSISYTTRAPRQNEADGSDYFFISPKEFEKRIRTKRWAEWALVHGNYYGTSLDYLNEKRDQGQDILLDIDVQGATQIVSHYPEAVTIFIMPPSFEVLRERLEKRATESHDQIERRLENARKEMVSKDFYKHTIINDVLSVATQQLIAIVACHGSNAGECGPGS
jgi:guanylate kinase